MNKRVTTFAILLALVLALLTPAAFAADEVAYDAQALDTNYALALAYIGREDYDKAMEYHLKALEIRETMLGMEHPDTATSYNNIGLVYHNQGDYPKALEYYTKALAIREKVPGRWGMFPLSVLMAIRS